MSTETQPDLTDITDYHADKTHITASMLKSLKRSPRIFEAEHIIGSMRKAETEAMAFGTALHTAVLEPERFASDYICPPAGCGDKRTNKYKDWKAEQDPKAKILSEKDHTRIINAMASVMRHPIASEAVKAEGVVEQPHTWIDEATGVPCKCRPDKRAGRVILDLKSINECSEEEFTKAVVNFDYHIQAAHYNRGFPDAEQFIFIPVETVEPFRCRCFVLDDEALDLGDYMVGELLKEYAERIESGDWSEPNESDLVKVSLPGWYMKKAYK